MHSVIYSMQRIRYIRIPDAILQNMHKRANILCTFHDGVKSMQKECPIRSRVTHRHCISMETIRKGVIALHHGDVVDMQLADNGKSILIKKI